MIKRTGILILILFSIIACEKDKGLFPDDISFKISKTEAETTDVLEFEIVRGDLEGKTTKIYYRWDWDGDSIWDTEYSVLTKLNKRFYAPGEYEVLMQYADGEGNTAFCSNQVIVSQGYSAPRPDFTVSPESGNYEQEYCFDPSPTVDDEDSLDQLLFRWDFQGDGFWDTDFDTLQNVTYKYNKQGVFRAKLEVKDPSNKFGSFEKEVSIHNIDTLIQVRVSWNPSEIRAGETVVFDASESFHSLYPDREFSVSWSFSDNPSWTAISTNMQIQHVFRAEGMNFVSCRIRDELTRLENTSKTEVYAADQNLPPEAKFELSIPYGNINTQFYFDCWLSQDDHLPTSQILIRWDWESDGIWDTPFTLEKEYYHQYSDPGEYTVKMQAMDDLQVQSTAYADITVSPYDNQTDYFRDHRDGEYYGTVKIGDQWWMAENLRFELPDKTKEGLQATLCLFEQDTWCESIGKLYHVSSVTNDRFDSREFDVCPNGWRIPTKDDIETLVQNIGGDSQAKELMFGGEADFNGLYIGYGSYQIIFEGFIPKDTIYNFHETFEEFYLPSNSIAPDINEARTDIYMIRISRSDESLWSGYNTTRHYMPVRCVKE